MWEWDYLLLRNRVPLIDFMCFTQSVSFTQTKEQLPSLMQVTFTTTLQITSHVSTTSQVPVSTVCLEKLFGHFNENNTENTISRSNAGLVSFTSYAIGLPS